MNRIQLWAAIIIIIFMLFAIAATFAISVGHQRYPMIKIEGGSASVTIVKPPLLLLEMNGVIDQVSLNSIFSASQTLEPGESLAIHMNSTGGYETQTIALGRLFNVLKAMDHKIYFFAGDFCMSGCMVLSGFSSTVFVQENTRFGFGHTKEEIGSEYPIIENMIYLNRGLRGDRFEKVMESTIPIHEARFLGLVDAVGDSKSLFSVFDVRMVQIMANSS